MAYHKTNHETYLKSKKAIRFLEKYAGVRKSTAKKIVNIIMANIDDSTFSLGINGDQVRVFFNTPTSTLAVGVEDGIGGLFIMLDEHG